MLILASTTDKLQVATGSAGQIDVHASWMDNVAGAVGPGRTNTATITTATTTDVVAAPASGTQRNVKTLHIRNRGATANTITVSHTDGTVVASLHSVILAPGATLQYIDEVGFIDPQVGRTILIRSQTVTSPVPSIVFTGINDTYDEYLLRMLAVRGSADDYPYLQISQDNGATWKTGATDYAWTYTYSSFIAAGGSYGGAFGGNFDHGILCGAEITAASTLLGSTMVCSFSFPYSTTLRKDFMGDSLVHHPTISLTRLIWGADYATDTLAFNAIRFLFMNLSTGVTGTQIAGGTFNLYGIQK